MADNLFPLPPIGAAVRGAYNYGKELIAGDDEDQPDQMAQAAPVRDAPLPLVEGEEDLSLQPVEPDVEDKTLDAEYRQQLQSAEDDDAVDWMKQMTTQMGIQDPNAAPVAGPEGEALPVDPNAEAAPGDERSLARRIAGDIGTGIVEAPKQIVGGARDAVVEGFMGLEDAIAPLLPGIKGGIQIWDKDGNFDLKLLSSEEREQFLKEGGKDLRTGIPDVADAESYTGAFVEGLSQFLTGFGVAGKAFTAMGYAAQTGNAAQIARAMAQAAAADFSSFDGQEARLSNLIQQFPTLQNPVTEFLASRDEDPEIVGRLKNVVEGAIPDVAFTALLQGLRAMKAGRRLKALTGSQSYAEMGEKLKGAIEAGDVPSARAGSSFDDLLGPEGGEAIVRPAPQFPMQEFGVPDDVVARGIVGSADDAQARLLAEGKAPSSLSLEDITDSMGRERAGSSRVINVIRDDQAIATIYGAPLPKDPTTFHVDYIRGDEGANGIGPEIRQVISQIKQMYPDVKTISGLRATGARAANPADVSVAAGKAPGTAPARTKADLGVSESTPIDMNRVGEINNGGIIGLISTDGKAEARLIDGSIVKVTPGPGTIFTAGGNEIAAEAVSAFRNGPTNDWFQVYKPGQKGKAPGTVTAPEAPAGTMRVYHGSPHEGIERLEASRAGTGEGLAPTELRGAYLTDTPAEAVEYARDIRGSENVYSVDMKVTQDELLDLAKPLSQQPEALQRAFPDSLKVDEGFEWRQSRDDLIGAWRENKRVGRVALDNKDKWYFEATAADGSKVRQAVASAEEGKAKFEEWWQGNAPEMTINDLIRHHGGQVAADELNKAGIKGAYLKGDGGRTHYTIVDDSALNIVKRSKADEFERGLADSAPPEAPGGLKAYHGSPHDFDKFQLDKIGTGEGAQTFGRGLYFAENESVAKNYGSKLAGQEYVVDGKVLATSDKPVTPTEFAVRQLFHSGEERAIATLPVQLANEGITDPAFRNAAELEIRRLSGSKIEQRDLGQLYEVEIDVKPEKLLDWDKPLGEQGEIGEKAMQTLTDLGFSASAGRTLADVKILANERFGGGTFQDAQVSQALRDAGIPGIRYLDQVSRDAGDGTRNIVVFDDTLVKITKKNGQPVTGAERAAAVDDAMGQATKRPEGEPGPASASLGAEDLPPQQAAQPQTGGASKVETPQGDLYINWARIDSSDSIKAVVRDMAEAFKPEIQQAQRGVRTNVETRLSAGKIDAFKTLMGERRIAIPSAEEQLALRQLWVSSGEKTLELARIADETKTEEALFALRKMMAIHGAVQREVMGIRTETARALQQWAIPAGSDAMRLRALQGVLDSTGGLDVTADIAAKLASLQGKEGAEHALDAFVRKSARATTMDAVREYWINALLSGPKTHLVNTMSNSMVIAQSLVERAVAGRIADVSGSIDGIRIGEATAMMMGIKQALPDAWRFAKRSWIEGGTTGRYVSINKTELPRTRTLSREVMGNTSNPRFNAIMNRPAVGAFIDMIGSVVSVPGRSLAAADEFFKTINYRAELWAVAFRQASEEVERGILPQAKFKERIADIIINTPDDVKLRAQDFAEYNTFTNDPGPFVKSIMRLRQQWPATQFILPFVQTPSNILRYTMERTPLAPITSKFRANYAAGGARRQLALAQMSVGTAVMLSVYDLTLNGQVTGSGPTNWRHRQALQRTGWQPYSVKVGGRYYAYNRLDPIGLYVGMAADFGEFMMNTDESVDAEWEEAFAAMAFSAADNFMSRVYMRGFADFMDATLSTGNTSMRERYLTSLASSFIPTGVAEITKTMDPQAKYTHDLISKFKSRLPGASKDIPPRLDFWGREISFQSGLGAAYDAVSPIYSRKEKPEPIDKELLRLKYYPDPHDAFIRLEGKNVSVRNRPQVIYRYHKLIGDTPASELPRELRRKTGTGITRTDARLLNSMEDMTLLEGLNAIVNGDHPMSVEYETAEDPEKELMIKKVIKAYRSAARVQVIEEFPDVRELRATIPD